jgi:hypothetical protein
MELSEIIKEFKGCIDETIKLASEIEKAEAQPSVEPESSFTIDLQEVRTLAAQKGGSI